LYALVDTIRLKETTYKSAGSVHACALFQISANDSDPAMLLFVEDVGRHNAIDTIAGWMTMNIPTAGTALDEGEARKPAARLDAGSAAAAGFVFYTTGRLTSEMVIKSAQMNVPIVISRSGITQMGHEVAQAVGLCAIGRATNKRFVCYANAQRLQLEPGLAGPKPLQRASEA
jgi:FdhD protein